MERFCYVCSVIIGELLEPGETNTGDRCRELIKLNGALKDKRSECAQIHNKVFVQYDPMLQNV